MSEEDELFKKCFMKTLKKLAEEPDEVINYNEQTRKYNNLLKEKIKLQQELQRKDNEIKQLQEDVKNHIKIASEYKEQMIIKDNIINDLKSSITDYQEAVGDYQDEIVRKDNIINECAEDILKELKENNHLSYGVALSIRQKLISYKELKENK